MFRSRSSARGGAAEFGPQTILTRTFLTLFTVSALLTLTLSPALAGDWKGTKETQEGVVHVMNPASGMESPVSLNLDEAWRLGGDSDAEEEFFGVINRVTTDSEGNVYLLDSQLHEVKVFSASGEYLRTFGREGEGPGEFRQPQDMFMLPDGRAGVLQLAPGRIVLFSKDGEPDGDHPVPTEEGGAPTILLGGQLMGDHLLLMGNSNKIGDGRVDITRYLAMVDSEGTVTKTVHDEVRGFEFANALIDEKIWSTFDRRWQTTPDGHLYVVTQFADYEVNVFNPKGDLVKVITRDYERLPRTQQEQDRVHGIFEAFTRQVPNAKIVVSKDQQDITTIHPRDDGSLWVLTSKGTNDLPDGTLGIFDVFDPEGRYVREVTLMGEGDPQQDGYFFVGDRLYVVTGFLDAAMAAQGGAEGAEETDEEAGPMAVICYSLDALEAKME